MTPEELKAKLEEQDKKLAEFASVKTELAEKTAALEKAEKSIENLDATAKEQKAAIDALRIEVKANKRTDFKAAFRKALEEKKDAIKELFAQKGDRLSVSLEMKAADVSTANMPTDVLGLQLDTTVHTAVPSGNVFIATFGLRARTGNKLVWLEGQSENGADYVAELAANEKKSDVTIKSKTRLFGKLATVMRLSTETEDWFEQLYNYCTNEGLRLIQNKLDAEIYGGAGNDSTASTKIYGLKGQATAFSAIAAGSIEKANIADVLMDAADQVRKNGYNPNVAFISWKGLRTLQGLKDAQGNYIYDKANQMLFGIRVVATSKVADSEALVVDTTCAEVYAGNGYEIEFIRNGVYDAYDVFFRLAAQVKVPTPKTAGIIYVADTATAAAALLKA